MFRFYLEVDANMFLFAVGFCFCLQLGFVCIAAVRYEWHHPMPCQPSYPSSLSFLPCALSLLAVLCCPAGASLLAAPFIAESLLADSPGGSFSALLVGFALSEAWRAPGAIMIRSVAPQELGSTASALYLCIR